MVVKYSQDLFRSFINSPYELNLLKNPSELIRKISSDIEISISYIFLILLILKEILILLAIFFLLFFTKKCCNNNFVRVRNNFNYILYLN